MELKKVVENQAILRFFDKYAGSGGVVFKLLKLKREIQTELKDYNEAMQSQLKIYGTRKGDKYTIEKTDENYDKVDKSFKELLAVECLEDIEPLFTLSELEAFENLTVLELEAIQALGLVIESPEKSE